MPINLSQPGSAEETRKKKKLTVFKSLKRRDLLILAAFWLTCLCVVGLVIGFLVLRRSSLAEPQYKLKPGEVTALTLYPAAEKAALAWESDVKLLSASATWDQASLTRLEQPVEWVYRFYSPGLQQILFVIVNPKQEVIVRPHVSKVKRESRFIDPALWKMDSPAAMTVWLNHGGGRWLQNTPKPLVSAQLAYKPGQTAPEWIISGLDIETGQNVNYTVTATSP